MVFSTNQIHQHANERTILEQNTGDKICTTPASRSVRVAQERWARKGRTEVYSMHTDCRMRNAGLRSCTLVERHSEILPSQTFVESVRVAGSSYRKCASCRVMLDQGLHELWALRALYAAGIGYSSDRGGGMPLSYLAHSITSIMPPQIN